MKLAVILFFIFKSITVYACEVDEFNYGAILLWVNKEKDETQPYIAPQKCLNTAKERHQTIGNNDAVIFFYDSEYTTEKALSSTKEYLQDLPQLRLCDVRDLDEVKKNEEIFRSPIPLFFRIDLLKVIVTLHLAAKKEFKYLLFADQDVPVKTKEHLFYKDKITNNDDSYYDNSRTLESLNRFGLTCCRKNDFSRTGLPENSFFILDRDNPYMLQAQQIGLVDINILRAKKALEKGYFGFGEQFYTKNPFAEHKEYVDMQQLVWTSFPGMVKLYYLKSGQGIVTDQNFQPDPDFDRENYNWIDLFDTEGGKFKRHTELQILVDYIIEGKKVETMQFAPEDTKDLLSGIHQKCVGQPKSQFVKLSYS